MTRTGDFQWGRVPERVHGHREFRTAPDAFVDGVSLHNDIVSYDREAEEGTLGNNGVEVTRKALGTGRLLTLARPDRPFRPHHHLPTHHRLRSPRQAPRTGHLGGPPLLTPPPGVLPTPGRGLA
ncbi:terpene synthase family protein [Streptomyces roseirectus]|uniref:terpene synthase family protein n=1 Tax=Streptomyces roseirectus TaxID=2768066 RepID=UPI0031B5B3E4